MKAPKMRVLAAFAVPLFVAACGALPHHAQTRADIVSSLLFKGGPENAVVKIDGVDSGRIQKKQTRISIADGNHVVVVEESGREIWRQKIFILDGTQKIINLSN